MFGRGMCRAGFSDGRRGLELGRGRRNYSRNCLGWTPSDLMQEIKGEAKIRRELLEERKRVLEEGLVEINNLISQLD